jgi:putative ABC transport system permease protein
LKTLAQDMRYGLRMLAKNPGFTAIAVLTLALGIGANTAIFSVVNAVLLRPLPYHDPGRLVVILQGKGSGPVSPANFVDWREQNQVFEKMGAAEWWSPNLGGEDTPEHLNALHITPDILALLEVNPMLGRIFTPEEGQVGTEHVAILSHGLWQRHFGGKANVIGQAVSLDGETYTVVGVMPAGFKFAPFWATKAELWAPLALGNRITNRGAQSLRVFARLKDGVTLEQARADIGNITRRLDQEFPGTNRDVQVTSLDEKVVGTVRPALLMLLGAVGFVLLIACVNVAHMLLARAGMRRKEIAIRAAIGASSQRLLRQMLTESTVLAVLGGLAGLLVASWGMRFLAALAPADIPGIEYIALDGRVLVFAVVIALITGLLFGMAPAMQASRVDLNESLKESGRGTTEGIHRNRARSLLVISEFAMALILLVGAGLMIRSFVKLMQIDPGFESHHLLAAVVSVTGTKEADPSRRAAFFQQAVENVKALPGIESASAINHLPLDGDEWGLPFAIEGRPLPRPDNPPGAVYRVTLPKYFQTMGIPLLTGRDFEPSDKMDSPRVVIINQQFAHLYWPGEDALGKQLSIYDPKNLEWCSVVGIVKNTKQSDWAAIPQPEMYFPYLQTKDYLQSPSSWVAYLTLVVRSRKDPLDSVSAIQSAIWSLDKNVPISNIESMDSVISRSVAQPRLYLMLLNVFAGIALILAAVGIYGVMSFSVVRRTHEIGVRLALGARQADVLKLVVAQGMVLATAGLAIGVMGAYAVTRFLSGLLYQVQPTDPATFVSVSLVLMAVALLACLVPARRAMKVDPMVALRYE